MTIQRFVSLAALALAAALSLAACATPNGAQECVNGTFCPAGAECSGDGTTCIFGGCGNAKADPGEACDDGNVKDGDGCSSKCTVEECGNGIVDSGELCDDGNDVNDDSCRNDCQGGFGCGNGLIDVNSDGQPIEECDDGDTIDDNGCTASCRAPRCGDGVTTTSQFYTEACDPGAAGETAACNSDCTAAACGDGKINQAAGEQCDAGAGNSPTGDCLAPEPDISFAGCKLNVCGDGRKDSEGPVQEGCDDGNKLPDDGCSAVCISETCGNSIVDPNEECDLGMQNSDSGACLLSCLLAECGDGHVQTGVELCDDGNKNPGDGCSATCISETCGNSIVDPNEECDLGMQNSNTGACLLSCQLAECGDGHVQDGVELCDDGNKNPGDGCSATCVVETCGNSTVDPMEECDLGMQNSNNGACLLNCQLAECGDGHTQTGVELCDDGNKTPGDGCSATCVPEACGNGIVDPLEECDLGMMNSDNGQCLTTCKFASCGDGHTRTGVEECDDGKNGNLDDCLDTCKLNTCGDGFRDMEGPDQEGCDDGNTTTELCDYGAPSCTVCNAVCQSVAGAIRVCGDGVVEAGEEACDDGNDSCGSCSADCQANTLAPARGSITVTKANDLIGKATPQTFTLHDGILDNATDQAVTFEFTTATTSTSDPKFVAIELASGQNATTVRSLVLNAINDVEMNSPYVLQITATVSGTNGSTLTLTHDQLGVIGNITIARTVTDADFAVSGMSGGLGADCAPGQVCRADDDCESNACQMNVCQ